MTLRTCDNCERDIGHLEDVFPLDEHKLCRECFERLRPDRDMASVRPGPVATPAFVPPTVVASRPPRRPLLLWAGLVLMLAGSVLVGLEIMKEAYRVFDSVQTSQEAAIEKLSELRDKTALASSGTAVIAMVLSIVHIIGFITAWRGYFSGAIAFVATGAVMTAMEFTGAPMIGAEPTGRFIMGFVLANAGLVCFVLPPAWEFYWRSFCYRRGESYK